MLSCGIRINLSSGKELGKYIFYLDIIHESKYRTSLTRLRLSSHDLAIESGRKYNTGK